MSPGSRDRVARALRGAAFYLVAFGLEIVVLPFVTRAVSLEVFARYTLIRVALPVAVVLADLGLGAAAIRRVADAEDPVEARGILSTSLWTTTLAAGLFAALVALAAVLWPEAVSGLLAEPEVLHFAALALFAQAVVEAATDALRALERHGPVAICRVVIGLTRAATAIGLVAGAGLGLRGLVLSLVFGYGAGLLVVLPFLLRTLAARPRPALLAPMFGFGLPLASATLVRAVGGLDRYVLRQLGSLAQAGLYQLASAPCGAIEVVERAGAWVIEPFVYGSLREGPDPLDRPVRLFVFATLATGVVSTLFGPEIFAILAPPEYRGALVAAPWVTFAAVCRSYFMVFGLGLRLARSTRAVALASLLELLLAGVLLVVLVPPGGATGAGVARLISAAVAVAVCYGFALRVWRRPLPLLAAFALTLASTVSAALLATPMVFPTAPLVARAAAAVLLVGASALVLRPHRGQGSMRGASKAAQS